MSREIKVWNSLRYHVAGRCSQTHADKDGCQVFEETGPAGVILVLAHDEHESEEAYQTELEDDPEWCPFCQYYGECFCEDDD